MSNNDEKNKACGGIFLLSEKHLEERLTSICLQIGIPLHIKGYRFLREAVKLAMYNPDMVNNLTKQLYPAVAKIFDTTPSKIERSIRHAIEVAWARGKLDSLNSLYGVKIFRKEDKPSNGELIALISDKLSIEFSISFQRSKMLGLFR